MPNLSLKLIFQQIQKSDFLKSSSLVFGINIINAVVNYALIVFVTRYFSDIGTWTSVSSWLQILTLPVLGILTELTRKSSTLSSDSKYSRALDYYYFLLKNIKKALPITIVLTPIIALVFDLLAHENYWIFLLLLVHIQVQVILGLNTQFLLGLLKLPGYIISTAALTLLRFALTIGFIILGFSEYSLLFGWILAGFLAFFVSRIFLKKIIVESNYDLSSKPLEDFHLASEIKTMLKSIFTISLLATFLNINPILVENIRTVENGSKFLNADLYGTIFSFGSILHFGAISFLGAIVAFGAKGKNLNIFLFSAAVVSGITLAGSLFLTLFFNLILRILNRAQYSNNLPEILMVFAFIFFYNLIYLSVQYLISQKQYFQNYFLLIPLFLLIALQLNLPNYYSLLGLNTSPLQTFMLINILVSSVSAVGLISAVFYHNQKSTNLKPNNI